MALAVEFVEGLHAFMFTSRDDVKLLWITDSSIHESTFQTVKTM